MKANKCVFDEKRSCTDPYCRKCEHLPDFSKYYGKHSLEYLMSIAISEYRKNKEKEYWVNDLDEAKDCPDWLYDIFDWPILGRIPGTDHTRIINYGGDWCITTEPYNMDMSTMAELIDFCEKKDLIFKISGVSEHFIGRTFRIFIYPKGKANKAFAFVYTNYLG